MAERMGPGLAENLCEDGGNYHLRSQREQATGLGEKPGDIRLQRRERTQGVSLEGSNIMV